MNELVSAKVWSRTLIPGTREWNSLAAFLFLSLTFVLPSGYSLGALMLLIGAIIALSRGGLPQITDREKFVIMAFVAYAVFWIGDGFLRGDGVSDADRPLRFLLAVPVILALKDKPPALAALVAGLIVGAIGAGGVAAYDVLVTGLARAKGFMPTNSFGMLTALFAATTFLSYQFMSWQKKSAVVRLLFLVASFGAVCAALLSGSRGAWLVLIGLTPMLLYLELRRSNTRHLGRLGAIAIIIFAFLIPFFSSNTVGDRIESAVTGFSEYLESGSAQGSIGTRLNMWKGAVLLLHEEILIGSGDYGYQEELERLAEVGAIEPAGKWDRHVHNQLLHVLLTKGIIGSVVWLLVTMTPVVATWRSSHSPSGTHKEDRTGVPRIPLFFGILLALAFIVGGLTRTPFEHHSSVMVFAFGVSILVGFNQNITKRCCVND